MISDAVYIITGGKTSVPLCIYNRICREINAPCLQATRVVIVIASGLFALSLAPSSGQVPLVLAQIICVTNLDDPIIYRLATR